MQSTKTKSLAVLALASMFLMAFAMTAFGAEGETAEYVPALFSTFWALVPPVVAIGLALITKEVYSSLFVGIAVGGILYSGGSFERTVVHIFQDGIIGVLTDESNVGILVFLVILGTMVSLMNKAGRFRCLWPVCGKGHQDPGGGPVIHHPSGRYDLHRRLFQLPYSGKRHAACDG